MHLGFPHETRKQYYWRSVLEKRRAKEANLTERRKSLNLPEFLHRISEQMNDSNMKNLQMFAYTIGYFDRSEN